MGENLKQEFLDIFNRDISRDGKDELMQWLESSDFFYAPASTKFHGSFECGLLKHSLNVYYALDKRVKADKAFRDEDNNFLIPQETIAIISLLHDVCKVNFYKKDKRNVKVDGKWESVDVFVIDEKFPAGDHADKSIILLQQFIKLTPEEILSIRAHMGEFDNAIKGGARFTDKIFNRSRLAIHLHIADLEASYLMGE